MSIFRLYILDLLLYIRKTPVCLDISSLKENHAISFPFPLVLRYLFWVFQLSKFASFFFGQL